MNASEMDAYTEWATCLRSAVLPVLEGFADKTLRTKFVPKYSVGNDSPNPNVPFIEMYCRTLLGVSPLATRDTDLSALLVRATNSVFVDKYITWECGDQLLVEMAILCVAFLRYGELWTRLPDTTQRAILEIVEKANRYPPHNNNWILFKCVVEVFLYKNGKLASLRSTRAMLTEFEKWYVGDGWYKDGAVFHMDYYNSFVILPFLRDIYNSSVGIPGDKVLDRLRRHCEFLERLIGSDGTYPLFGRSMVYRCGVFHALAYTASLKKLPPSLSYSQVRCALTAVLRKTFTSQIYDEAGFLRLGFGCEDRVLADAYSNNGSAYYCLLMFSPLALPPSDEFWSAEPTMWTQQRAWLGNPVPRDKSIS